MYFMRKQVFTSVFITLTVCSIISCNRKENEEIAGKGGSATLKITSQHHGKNIDSCTIYIKYNTLDAPSSYDDSVRCVLVDGKPVATFNQLKKGKYYLFGRGWDPSIVQAVRGGIPYTIKEEQNFEINIPVTEDH